MGLPLLALPEAMLPQLETVLRQHGIEVEEMCIAEQDDPKHFLKSFLCKMGSESVRLSVQRELHVNQDGPVIIISPR
jgi:hypothetical protein